MLPNGLELVTPAEWEDAVVRAAKYTSNFIGRLPRHLTVDDVVHTAVERVLAGDRQFEQGKYSLAAVLCGTVRSILSKNGLAEYRDRMPLATDVQMATTAAPCSDDESLFSASDRDLIMDLARQKANGDMQLVDYIEAFRANFTREETAQLLGIRVEDCYELQRKLKLTVTRVVKELKPADLRH